MLKFCKFFNIHLPIPQPATRTRCYKEVKTTAHEYFNAARGDIQTLRIGFATWWWLYVSLTCSNSELTSRSMNPFTTF